MPINRGHAPKPVRPTPAPRDQPDPAPAAPGCALPATMATPRSPRAHPSCPGEQHSPPAGPGLQRPGRCGRAGAPGSGLARRSGARQRRRRQEEQEEEKEEKRGSKGGARPLRREPAGFAEPPGAASRRCAGQPPGAPSGRGCRGAGPGAGMVCSTGRGTAAPRLAGLPVHSGEGGGYWGALGAEGRAWDGRGVEVSPGAHRLVAAAGPSQLAGAWERGARAKSELILGSAFPKKSLGLSNMTALQGPKAL